MRIINIAFNSEGRNINKNIIFLYFKNIKE